MTTLTSSPPIASRAEAVAWAASVAADRSAVFLDTETTGLGDAAEICDIGIVSVDGTNLLNTLVMPVGTIPREATAVHGITRDMCAFEDAPSWDEVYPRAAVILHGRRIVTYNAAFDAATVNQSCRFAHVPELAVGWECAMEAFAAHWGERRFGGGFRWCKLGEACARLGIELDGAHRALADAEACRRVVLAMAKETTTR